MKKIALCVDSSWCCSFSHSFLFVKALKLSVSLNSSSLHKGANISVDVTSETGMAKLQEGLGSSELTLWKYKGLAYNKRVVGMSLCTQQFVSQQTK